jgi:hypothetical protein
MIRDEPTLLTIDHGRDGDEFAEVTYRLLPDGTREIVSMRTWKGSIRIGDSRGPTPPRALAPWSGGSVPRLGRRTFLSIGR